MLNYFYFYLILNFLAPLMCALRCHYGKEIIHAFSKSVSGNNVECSEEESFCLRIESVGTQFSFPGNLKIDYISLFVSALNTAPSN